MLPELALAFLAPLDPPWLIVAWSLALVAVLFASVLYLRASTAGRVTGRRRVVMLGLRLVAIGAMAWILAGPIVLEPQVKPELRAAPLWLLIDTSASMAERDVRERGDRISRFASLRRTWLAADQLDAWQARGDLHLLGFAGRVQPLASSALETLQPTGNRTHLYEALEQVRQSTNNADASPPVVVVLSDGHDTQREHDPTLLAAIRRSGMMVHVVPLGDASARPTLTMQAWSEADHLFAGQSTTLHAALWQRRLVGRRVRVELWHEGHRLDARSLTLDELPEQTVSFSITPPAPADAPLVVHAYELHAQMIDDESDERLVDDVKPAARSVFVQVSDERIRVALLEGEPHWETRFLARLLRSDPRIELTSVHRLGAQRLLSVGPGSEAVNAAAIASSAWLNHFDVIVLGQRMERLFPGSAASLLVDYVQQRGGALVLARGRPFDVKSKAGRTAMAVFDAIAPVQWTDNQQATDLRLQATRQGDALLTDGGADVPSHEGVLARLAELPAMLAATRFAQEKPAAVVLLRQTSGDGDADGMAALAQLRAGRGQVLAVLTEGLWQWAMLPRRLAAHAGVYERFWSRLIHWLAAGGEFMPGQDVSLLLSHMAVEPGATVRATVTTRYLPEQAFEPTLRITSPHGQVRTLHFTADAVQPTQHHVSFVQDIAGVYEVELIDTAAGGLIDVDAPITRQLIVEDRSLERLDTAARPGVLVALAEASGGRTFALDEANQLLAHVEVEHERRRERVEPVARDAFARWPVLLLVLGSLTLEWWMRRRSGMV